MLFAAAGLAACGGGGSDTPTSSTTAPPAATPAPGPAPAPAPGPAPAPAPPAPSPSPAPAPAPAPTTAGSTCGLPDFAATALARINQLRAAGADCHTRGKFGPAAALTWSALLTQSAEGLSQDMVAKNFFSHTGSNGSTLGSRVDATGYAWSGLGENIAAGYPTIDAVMTGWITSDGHCENLMNPGFNQVGLVCVSGTATTNYNTYWTMDLAKSR